MCCQKLDPGGGALPGEKECAADSAGKPSPESVCTHVITIWSSHALPYRTVPRPFDSIKAHLPPHARTSKIASPYSQSDKATGAAAVGLVWENLPRQQTTPTTRHLALLTPSPTLFRRDFGTLPYGRTVCSFGEAQEICFYRVVDGREDAMMPSTVSVKAIRTLLAGSPDRCLL